MVLGSCLDVQFVEQICEPMNIDQQIKEKGHYKNHFSALHYLLACYLRFRL